MSRNTTRRRFLQLTGATASAAILGAGTAAADSQSEWRTAETPVDGSLHDIQYTVDGAYAVGDGGVVLRRSSEGWEKVLDGGPTGNGNDLYGAGVTDYGDTLWFVGASGAIGEYKVSDGVVVDHSAPDDVTNNFNDVAVRGNGDDENVYVAGDSGKIYSSFDGGATGTWDEVTPGSGSNVNALDVHGPRSGHAVDGNTTVFETDDGTTWNGVGIEGADYNFYGVDSDGADDVTVCGGGGSIYDWNGTEWRREGLGDADLRDVEVSDSGGLTVGAGGAVFRRGDGGWTRESTPVGENLQAVYRGHVDIAVGAGGTVIEHP
jgi:hypothetical protein